MDITAAILTGALVFGLSTSDYNQKNAVDVQYKLVSVPVHEVSWAGSRKLNGLTAVKEIRDNKSLYFDTQTGTFSLKYPYRRDNGVYSVYFTAGSDTPNSARINNIMMNLPAKEALESISVIGYASPDGADPEMRIDLAKARAAKVNDVLSEYEVEVADTDARVCSADEVAAECRRADIIIRTKDDYENSIRR